MTPKILKYPRGIEARKTMAAETVKIFAGFNADPKRW
jgi:hypothetical protein